jgi:hypothetical protein
MTVWEKLAARITREIIRVRFGPINMKTPRQARMSLVAGLAGTRAAVGGIGTKLLYLIPALLLGVNVRMMV